MKQRTKNLLREMTNVRGELLLMKRSHRRLYEKLDLLLRAQGGLATLLVEHRNVLEELKLANLDIKTKVRPNNDLEIGMRKAA